MFERAGSKTSNVKGSQLWQYNNKPIELYSNEVIDQKVDYIHQNPVVSGFVNESDHWRYSSAIDYSGGKGVLVNRNEIGSYLWYGRYGHTRHASASRGKYLSNTILSDLPM